MSEDKKYGEWIRKRRREAGLTQEKLADLAFMTRSHITHIEAGRRKPSEEDALRLDQVLGTGDVLTSFRPRHDGTVADYFDPARQLEQQASQIREFAMVYVPGILQTEAYARSVIGCAFPPHTPQEGDKHVITRLNRAKILEHPVSPVVWALLDETVLRRPVGGTQVMAEQIEHLVSLVERERIRLHVLPFDLGTHNLMDGMLTLMWFEDQPPLRTPKAWRSGSCTTRQHSFRISRIATTSSWETHSRDENPSPSCRPGQRNTEAND